MTKVYVQEGKGDNIVTREIDLPGVPAKGATFNFMDGAGPELDYTATVENVEYVVQKTTPVTGSERKSKLERIIVHVKTKSWEERDQESLRNAYRKANEALDVISGFNKEKVEAGEIGKLQSALEEADGYYKTAEAYRSHFAEGDERAMESLKSRLDSSRKKVVALENNEGATQ